MSKILGMPVVRVISRYNTGKTGRDGRYAHVSGESPRSHVWTATLPIQGAAVAFQLDSGADATLLSHSTYLTLRLRPTLQPTTLHLSGPTGQQLDIMGTFDANTTWKGQSATFPVYVVNGPLNLLSRTVCSQLGLLLCTVSTAKSVSSSPSLGCMKGPPELGLHERSTCPHSAPSGCQAIPLSHCPTCCSATSRQSPSRVGPHGPHGCCLSHHGANRVVRSHGPCLEAQR